MGVREESRRRTTAAILAAARAEIAESGGVGLSMRKVAREVGLASSAVYRYFSTREALLTALIIESYGNLAAALAQAQEQVQEQAGARHSAAGEWAGLARGLRDWARAHPHEFQLVYGTPVPGYVAPVETVPAAAAVAAPFLTAASAGSVIGFDDPELVAQMAALDDFGGSAAVTAAVLAELAALVGFIGLELAGHFVGTADPGDALFDALVQRQVETLSLSG